MKPYQPAEDFLLLGLAYNLLVMGIVCIIGVIEMVRKE